MQQCSRQKKEKQEKCWYTAIAWSRYNMEAVSSCGEIRQSKCSKVLSSFSRTSFVSFNSLFFFFCFFFFAVPFSFSVWGFTPHTERSKGVSYRDTIVCAVSKGDLLKELWCAVISPTSVMTARADACDQGGWRGAGLTTCSGFIDVWPDMKDCGGRGEGIKTGRRTFRLF